MDYLDIITSLYTIESDRACEEFDKAFDIFCNHFYNGTITESVSEPFGSSIKKFFVNLITALRNYLNKFKNYMSKTARDFSYSNSLSKIEKEIRKAKEEGKTKVTMPDYVYIRNVYKDMCNDLKGYAKKFVRMKYNSTADIDRDLSEFNKISDKWDKKMAKAVEKKVTLDIDDALRFVENERRGYTHNLDVLNETINQIDDMRHVAEETAKRVDSLGSEIIPKHVNCLKRVAQTISNKITKFMSKTIFVNVLLFA